MKSILLASAAIMALATGAARAEFALTILHTNDFHDRFEPISKSDSTCAPEDNAAGECFGGIARLTTALSEARGQGGTRLLLDAGDQFQGSLFYTRYKGEAAAEFLNALSYDAMTVGNHEFDDGPAVLTDFARKLSAPLLMANADLTGEPDLREQVKKSVVVEKAGEKIGIVGLTPLDTAELASPGPNVIFTEPVQAAQAEVDRLTDEGVTKIVLLSHLGYEADKRIASTLRGVDVIVGGHSHTLLGNGIEGAAGPYPTMVGKVAIVTAYAYGKYLGELNVTFDDAGELISAEGAPRLLDASVAEDAAALARVKELAAPLEEIRNREVATAAEEIDGTRESCRSGECEMGNLVAEAMLDRVREQGIQIAIANGGGLRASIDAGTVTMGEVLTVLPFQNTLSTFQVTGATVVEALENGVSQIEEVAGRFPQVAGLKYTFDPAAPSGSRVSEVMVMEGGNWQPIDPARTYGVVSNNYVRQGGDGYAMFVDAANAYDYGPDLAEVTAEYLAARAPYAPAIDGRITRR
ncbi:bifunctional UDP-sugar hydrolase/5'-nucleotidase [Rhodobacter sp. CZR27]|uniref:bifunctional metallophosphatase/5'-nucleotidase n=1 Tax=Rhodobacter sp. CZR27 TaxID=2033869 RepID=UPI000BBEC438|nr:bifunctional metallophosphatase/5'-nucleotidase [Rhodobacter sp. CZR27]